MKDIFVDRFLKCTASQGVVRLDFGRVESIDNDKNEISVAPSARLVLPMAGLCTLWIRLSNCVTSFWSKKKAPLIRQKNPRILISHPVRKRIRTRFIRAKNYNYTKVN